MAIDTASLDSATTRLTAFHSFTELVNACKSNGYVPTLDPRGPRPHDIAILTHALEQMGYLVYKGKNEVEPVSKG